MVTYVMLRSFTKTEEQRPSGEHERLATTAFSFPEDVPVMLMGLIRGEFPLDDGTTYLSNQMS